MKREELKLRLMKIKLTLESDIVWLDGEKIKILGRM